MPPTLPLADLMGLLPIVLLASAVIGVLAAAARPKTAFEISIEEGSPIVTAGEPPTTFVLDVQRICGMWGIESGIIRGVEAGQATELVVKGAAADQTQAFVNAWRNPI